MKVELTLTVRGPMFSMEVHSEEVDDRLKRIIVRFTTLKKKTTKAHAQAIHEESIKPRIIHMI